MELGKRVRVSKVDHVNDIATITLMVGTGYRKKKGDFGSIITEKLTFALDP